MSEAALQASSGPWRRLRSWARSARLGRRLAIVLAAAALAAGIATHLAWTRAGPKGPDPDTMLILLNVDLALLLLLVAVVLRRLVAIWLERRRGQAGARLHARLVGLFSVVAITPTIVVAAFSAYFVNFGLESWFSDRVRTALGESVAVADAYYAEHRQAIRADALAMGLDIARNAILLQNDARRFSLFLEAQASLRDLTEAVVFTGDGTILARTGLAFSVILEPISIEVLRNAQTGEVILLESGGDDRVRALLRLDNFVDAYLIVGRFVDARVLSHVSRVHEATDQYMLLEGKRFGLQLVFASIYVVVALLLLFAAVWVGLDFATRLAGPIAGLVAAAERVRAGDLAARVSEQDGPDELGTLARAFNRMTHQLDSQRNELIAANRQIDARARFTESVLSGVSAGVIGLDAEGRIELPNRSALRLLDTSAGAAVGRPLAVAVPEMADLLAAARTAPDGWAEDQVEITRGRRTTTLIVRVSREEGSGGFVVTFDDMTALVSAQRTAAWADVARRIAHEIKNPLTPIQLAAERLKRKYLKQIAVEPDAFTLCTDTIVRQVADLRRMVDEFSTFARMPAPTFADEDVNELVIEAMALHEVANPAVAFERELPETSPIAHCDRRQIVQVLTNLLQNAIDAIEARIAPPGGILAPGRVVVRVVPSEGAVAIEVVDNGRGLPAGSRDRLTEPYVTTRAKGTGLGLAIVKRIVQDHGGVLTLEDASGGGTCVRIVLLAKRHEAAGESKAATG